MMACDKDLILLYSSEELSEKERHGVQAHLDSCQECQNTLAEIQDMKESFKDLAYLTPGYDVLGSVLHKKTPGERLRAFVESLNPKILAGATLSVLVLSIILPYEPPPEQAVETPDPDYLWKTDFDARQLRYRLERISSEAHDKEEDKTPFQSSHYKTLKRRMHLVRKSSW